jgi:hypothetical protein
MPPIVDGRIELVAETSVTLIDGETTEVAPRSGKLRLTACRQGSTKREMIFESTSFKLTSLSAPTGDAETILNGMIQIAKALGLVVNDEQDRPHWYARTFKRQQES